MKKKQATKAIIAAEKAHDRAIEEIARSLIARRDEVRVILIGGPSSAGKTTFAKRLSWHFDRDGASTLAISTDDYFVGDARNPRDEHGNLDYEHIRAMDVERLNSDLVALVSGRETILPRFDFQRHEPMKEGIPTRLASGSFIIIEGLHSLNPDLTPLIPANEKALILADTTTNPYATVPGALPGDQRLLRRIIRDSNYRGRAAADTILLWKSVQAGEDRWIRPFTGNAEIVFDTTLPYEPMALRPFVLPELLKLADSAEIPALVRETSKRLAADLAGFEDADSSAIPGYSILREYIGGSVIQY